MTTMTDQELDAVFERSLRLEYEASERRRVRDYCEMVDHMTRRALLTAHGWDTTKANTGRLRQLAKERIRAGDPHFDIWCGWNAQ